MPDTIHAAYVEASGNDTSIHVADETFYLICIIKANRTFHFVTFFHTGNHKGRMTANLEMNLISFRVVNMPDDMNLVTIQTIGNAQHKVIGVTSVSLGGIFQGESHLPVSLGNELEVHVTGKTVALHFIFIPIQTVTIVPQSANNREKNG